MALKKLQIQRFLFEDIPVRGVAVRLIDSWQEILHRKASSAAGAYPQLVQNILGELTTAAVLMQAHVKLNGVLIIQMQNLGPLQMAVAEVSAELGVRATAKLAKDAEINKYNSFADLVQADRSARCAITFNPADEQLKKQAYQGIVPLYDAQDKPTTSIAQALQEYMLQSEQLDTTFMLAADEKTAAGLLVQRMPSADNVEETQLQYEHLSILARSLKMQELLTLDVPEVLRRLFWNEKLLAVSAEDEATPHFACTCNHERVANMLRGLGQEEVNDMLKQQDKIEIDCSFCGKNYVFDVVDAMQLFVQDEHQVVANHRKQ